MGCDQSTLANERDIDLAVGKSIRAERRAKPTMTASGKPTTTTTAGQTERLISAQMKQMQSSNTSHGTTSGLATISLEADEETSKRLPKLNDAGQLMPEEVVRRTSSSLDVSTVTIGNNDKPGGKTLKIQYAYRSQRGYYPDDPLKDNQDKYGITLNFGGEAGDAMFAVYDGHGTEGHDCASFAKKKLPQNLAKYLRQKRAQKYMAQLRAEGKSTKGGWNPKQWPMLSEEEYNQCCIKAFQDTNSQMHTEPTVDDKLSGTTAATVCFHFGRMTICNVGDSRVLLGHRVPPSSDKNDNNKKEESFEEEKCEIDAEPQYNNTAPPPSHDGELLPIPLTRDQTPYRRDERERLQKLGAEIKSIDQVNGKEEAHDNWGDMVLGKNVDIQGDPPRVWVKGKQYPGTAFTRSIGDRLAEDIGVCPEPEIVSAYPTCNDEFLVIASDGIFEFLTNDDVLNICAASLSPQEACEVLTKAAYEKWVEHEHRTDDITVIVCFLSSSFEPTENEEKKTSTEALVHTLAAMYGSEAVDVSNVTKIMSSGTTSTITKNDTISVQITKSDSNAGCIEVGVESAPSSEIANE